MARLALATAIALALLLGQAAVSLARSAPDACSTACTDDGPDGRCSPACEDACCASPLRTLMVNPDPVAPPSPSHRIATRADRGREASGEPRDVFHVPRTRSV